MRYFLCIAAGDNDFNRFVFQPLCLMNRNCIGKLERHYGFSAVFLGYFLVNCEHFKAYACSIFICINKLNAIVLAISFCHKNINVQSEYYSIFLFVNVYNATFQVVVKHGESTCIIEQYRVADFVFPIPPNDSFCCIGILKIVVHVVQAKFPIVVQAKNHFILNFTNEYIFPYIFPFYAPIMAANEKTDNQVARQRLPI